MRYYKFVILICSLGAVAAANACDDPGRPANVNLSGSRYALTEYVTADSSHFAVPDLCVNLADPPNPNSTSLGSASLDFRDDTVGEQQVRLEHFACSGSVTGDTVLVDQERRYSVEGQRVRIRRPRANGAWYEDTGLVGGDTLAMTVHQCADAPCATILWLYARQP